MNDLEGTVAALEGGQKGLMKDLGGHLDQIRKFAIILDATSKKDFDQSLDQIEEGLSNALKKGKITFLISRYWMWSTPSKRKIIKSC